MRASTAFLALASAQSTYAWGNLGHETVAFIAENLITANGEAWAQLFSTPLLLATWRL